MIGVRYAAPLWRLCGLLVLVLATVGPVPASGAGPTRAARGRLAGDTTVQWRGVAGIRLDTKPGGRLTERAITLDLRGGTYADVHLVPMPQPVGCVRDAGAPYCFSGAVRHFRPLAALEPDQRPGRANHYLLWDPPTLFAPRLDLYLFTDGVATLRIRETGYSGRTSYVANGRVRGKALTLPATCPGVDCGASAVAGGGREFRAGSHAFAIVLAYDLQPATLPAQPGTVRPCLYPNEYDGMASPRAADHPTGCDAVDTGSLDYARTGYVAGAHVGPGVAVYYVERDVSGPRYAGFLAAGAAAPPARRGGWVVWFDYGIR